MENVSLLVNSCDKYATAWYPYFELVKKYWPEHPKKIYLNSERKRYICENLNIISINASAESTWSARLYRALEAIDTKYVIFSLEDFFLLGKVDQKAIDQCIEWMEDDPDIAVCRLSTWDAKGLEQRWKGSNFRIAPPTMKYRLDTQVALWNRETLMSFIDLSESPWEFEGNGSKRIISSNKKFLWYFQEDVFDINKMIFPYSIDQRCGYGIAWGKWLWNNKRWFLKNGINHVQFSQLGILSERNVKARFNILYNNNPQGVAKIAKPFYRGWVRIDAAWRNIRCLGLRRGLKEIKSFFIKSR